MKAFQLAKTTLVALAVTAAVSGTAMAEDSSTLGSLYLVPGIGYANTDSDLDADNDVAYSLRLGKELSQHWDVQLGLSHLNADEDSSRFNGGDYKQTILGLDALYMFSRDNFRPFLLAGIGAARNRLDYDAGTAAAGRGSNTSWMANVGAGFQYFVSERFGLQADLRHVWSEAEARTVFGRGNDDKVVGNTYLNLGVIFRLDAPKQVVAEAAAPAAPAVEPTPVTPAPVAPAAEPVVMGPDKPAFEKITLQAEVLFDFDKNLLKDEGKKTLDVEVTEKMKAHPEVELVLISGHTDFIGDDKYNQKLSERRADAVKKYLVSQGIEESRLHTVGKGETQPVADCKGIRGKKLISCLQPNRRVVVEIEVQRAVEK